MSNTLLWLQDWYHGQCNGDWEHENQVKIYTLDNPGWAVEIDLADIEPEIDDLEFVRFENSIHDWYDYSITNQVFSAGGDLSKLQLLLEIFRKIIIEAQAQRNSI